MELGLVDLPLNTWSPGFLCHCHLHPLPLDVCNMCVALPVSIGAGRAPLLVLQWTGSRDVKHPNMSGMVLHIKEFPLQFPVGILKRASAEHGSFAWSPSAGEDSVLDSRGLQALFPPF